MAGGLRPGRKLKAVIPGGSSAKVLRADERFKLKERQTDGSTIEREIAIDDIPMDFDSLAAAGSMAGSGGVIVLDDSRDMVWALNNINKFYAHESCRPMHALPGRLALDAKNYRPHAARRRRGGRSENTENDWR